MKIYGEDNPRFEEVKIELIGEPSAWDSAPQNILYIDIPSIIWQRKIGAF